MKHLLSVLLVGLLLFMSGCGNDEEPRLRALHASPDTGGIDIFVEDDEIISDLNFRDSSDYEDVETGQQRVRVRESGGDTLEEFDVNFPDDTDLTAIVTGFRGDPDVILLTDDTSEPPSGQARIRAVHSAPNAGPVDVYVTQPGADLNTATPQIVALSYTNFSQYLQVQEGTYQIRVTSTGFKDIVIDSGPVQLDSRQVRTAVAVNPPQGAAGPFGLVVLTDRD